MISALLLITWCLSAPADVTIDTDSITLNKLIPFPASDSRGALSLGFAPNPGLARRFSKDELLAKITAAGFSTEDLKLPDSILVHRLSQGLDRDRVTRTVLEAFTHQYPGGSVEIQAIEIPGIQIGTGNVDIAASIPAHVDPSGPVFVKLDVRGDSFVRTLFIRTSVRIETMQPVIARQISAQSRIRPEDVEWKSMPLQGNHEGLTSLARTEGMVAKRDLEAGIVLSMDLLYMPVYVSKGDAVTVKGTSGGVTVSATMRARESGKFGDSIVVEHLSGAGTTTARVIGPKTLEVIQGAK
jgi:flagella basal body P-ring formation protein FlgA